MARDSDACEHTALDDPRAATFGLLRPMPESSSTSADIQLTRSLLLGVEARSTLPIDQRTHI